eukprot:11407185-Alexandrium_andersonii.AAC.1
MRGRALRHGRCNIRGASPPAYPRRSTAPSREPTLILHTDSTSAQSLASRVGLGRKSKHIQL